MAREGRIRSRDGSKASRTKTGGNIGFLAATAAVLAGCAFLLYREAVYQGKVPAIPGLAPEHSQPQGFLEAIQRNQERPILGADGLPRHPDHWTPAHVEAAAAAWDRRIERTRKSGDPIPVDLAKQMLERLHSCLRELEVATRRDDYLKKRTLVSDLREIETQWDSYYSTPDLRDMKILATTTIGPESANPEVSRLTSPNPPPGGYDEPRVVSSRPPLAPPPSRRSNYAPERVEQRSSASTAAAPESIHSAVVPIDAKTAALEDAKAKVASWSRDRLAAYLVEGGGPQELRSAACDRLETLIFASARPAWLAELRVSLVDSRRGEFAVSAAEELLRRVRASEGGGWEYLPWLQAAMSATKADVELAMAAMIAWSADSPMQSVDKASAARALAVKSLQDARQRGDDSELAYIIAKVPLADNIGSMPQVLDWLERQIMGCDCSVPISKDWLRDARLRFSDRRFQFAASSGDQKAMLAACDEWDALELQAGPAFIVRALIAGSLQGAGPSAPKANKIASELAAMQSRVGFDSAQFGRRVEAAGLSLVLADLSLGVHTFCSDYADRCKSEMSALTLALPESVNIKLKEQSCSKEIAATADKIEKLQDEERGKLDAARQAASRAQSSGGTDKTDYAARASRYREEASRKRKDIESAERKLAALQELDSQLKMLRKRMAAFAEMATR